MTLFSFWRYSFDIRNWMKVESKRNKVTKREKKQEFLPLQWRLSISRPPKRRLRFIPSPREFEDFFISKGSKFDYSYRRRNFPTFQENVSNSTLPKRKWWYQLRRDKVNKSHSLKRDCGSAILFHGKRGGLWWNKKREILLNLMHYCIIKRAQHNTYFNIKK